MELVEVRDVQVTRLLPTTDTRLVRGREGARAIRDLAVQLLLPQTVVATAQYYFHRHSTFHPPSLHTAAASLFLAAKSCDHPIPASRLCSCLYSLDMTQRKSKMPDLQIPPLSLGMQNRLQEVLFTAEFAVFETNVDCLTPVLPYSLLSQTLKTLLPTSHQPALLQVSRNFLNDSFFSPLCIQKSAQQLADACIFLAGKYLNLEVDFEADEATVSDILQLYNV